MGFLQNALKKWLNRELDGQLAKRVKPLIDSRITEKVKPRIAASSVLANPYLVGKRLNPPERKTGHYVIAKQQRDPGAPLPVPPEELREGYGKSDDEYLNSGSRDMKVMLDLLRAEGAEPETFQRVLDFGCAAGRMLRFFPRGEAQERWGIDLKGETILWCQQNLAPEMKFAAGTTIPHLPFEDNSFDMVYAGSVFTHIADLPDMWFLELRRILKPSGYLYVTIFDKEAIRSLKEKHQDNVNVQWFIEMLNAYDEDTKTLQSDFAMFSFEGGSWGGFPVPQVGFDRDYLRSHWGSLMRLASVTDEAYGYQSGYLFQKG